MNVYVMLRAILILLCLDHVMLGIGIIAYLIFGRDKGGS